MERDVARMSPALVRALRSHPARPGAGTSFVSPRCRWGQFCARGQEGSSRHVWERSAPGFSLPNGTRAHKRALRSHLAPPEARHVHVRRAASPPGARPRRGQEGSSRHVWERSAHRFSLPNGTSAPKRGLRSHPARPGARHGRLRHAGFAARSQDMSTFGAIRALSPPTSSRRQG